jgi:hypothetical protein
MFKIPTLKKKISAFMNCEEGKISKEKIVKVGGFITTLALGNVLSFHPVSADGHSSIVTYQHLVNHANQASCTSTGSELTSLSGHANGIHSHHGSHSVHGVHGSHGSHGSHSSY